MKRHSTTSRRRRQPPNHLGIGLLLFLVLVCPLAVLPLASASATADTTVEPHEPIIGVDLGTTYSCVAVMKDGKVEILVNDQGNRITPSYVAFSNGERLIGDAAKNQLARNPTNTIFDVKRLIGRGFSDKEVQADIKHLPFAVKPGQADKPVVEVDMADGAKQFTPEEISAMVLSKMKDVAESYLGQRVRHAVVTVPAYFNDRQRQATKDAGAIAGLNVVRVLNEPTAAALAYGLNKGGDERHVLVYDLGGGTFDVSLLTLENDAFQVLATAGDTRLGGEDFDQRVINHLVKSFKAKHQVDITEDPKAMGKLKREAEKAKRTLSSQLSARIEIESLVKGIDMEETLTRAKFDELNADLFEKTLAPVRQVLRDAKVDKRDVTDIVLVGGSTRIPKVQSLVEAFFGKKASTGVNPDEAVAFGAAVQAGIIAGEDVLRDVLILDANPLTLGIETTGGIMTKLIPRNTGIPTRKSQIFSTAADNQNVVRISVYEGERALTRDNHLLGRFDLTGIAPAPRGVPQIEVSFALDANGILQVTAHDKGTGNQETVTINNDSGRLTQAEIDRMVADAEKFAEQDRAAHERVEARNSLETYTYALKTQLADTGENGLGARLTEVDKEAISDAIDEAVAWLGSDAGAATADDFNEQKEKLAGVVDPITSRLYDTNDNSHMHDEL